MRTCTICSHKERKKIETAIASGESYRRIASQFGTSDATLRRHKECVVEILQKTETKRELSTIATVREVLESLTWDMRADLTDLFDANGDFDISDIRARGLGRMLKSLTFKREADGTRVVDVVKIDTHSQLDAKKTLLNAYTKLEIAKLMNDGLLLSDRERTDRVMAILDAARARRNQQIDGLSVA